MKEIYRIITLYDQLKASATPAALAVVVNVNQSSYRRIGARLLVAADGRYVGGISGGCLEGDALRRAKTAISANRPAVHVYDTLDGEDAVIGIGLGCEGRIDVLFIPLDYADEHNEVETLRGLTETRVPVLLVRRLDDGGDGRWDTRLYQKDQLNFLSNLTGRAPVEFTELSRQILRDGRSRATTIRGERGYPYSVLFEVLHPQIHLVLTGVNYDIPPTLTAARHLGWRTTVIGPQRKFSREITRLADRMLDYADAHLAVPDTATAVVLMSHDFDWDRRMVEHFLPLQPAYFGMLGPRKRAVKMDALLREHGDLRLLEYPNLYSPVGLDVGAETPEEIAASLTTEIIAVFRGRNGGMLRERIGSIHVR